MVDLFRRYGDLGLFGLVTHLRLRRRHANPKRQLCCRCVDLDAVAQRHVSAQRWYDRCEHILCWRPSCHHAVLYADYGILLRSGGGDEPDRISNQCVHLQLGNRRLERLEQHLLGKRASDSDCDLRTLGRHCGSRCKLYSDQTCNQSDGE